MYGYKKIFRTDMCIYKNPQICHRR